MMATPFDPYYQWLGIRDPQRPPNHYRLLAIDLFESDEQVIAVAADRQMTHLRTFQNGPHSLLSQQLLNEVSAARLCLLDPAKKRVYDEQLRAQQVASTPSETRPAQPTNPPKPAAAAPVTPAAPQIQIDTQGPLRLQRPGRGERDRVSRKLVIVSVLGVLAFSAAGWYYRYQVDHRAKLADMKGEGELAKEIARSLEPIDTTQASPSTGAPSDETAGTQGDQRPTTDAGESPQATDTNKSQPNTEAAGEKPANENPTTEPPAATTAGSEGSSTASNEGKEPVWSDTVTEEPTTSNAPALDWNPEDLVMTGQPWTVSTVGPAGTLVTHLTRRELSEARALLASWDPPNSSPLPRPIHVNLQLVFEMMDEFWSAVEYELTGLEPGTALTFRTWKVTVAAKNNTHITLEAATGKRHEFELKRIALHRDLAIALVERHYRDSPGTAARLIGGFLLLDAQGDARQAQEYWLRANAAGFSTYFLEDAIRRFTTDLPVGRADAVSAMDR